LYSQENLGKLMFWGKLLGETNDYLIAYALIPSGGFPSKKFFYWYSALNVHLALALP
jgi:hypothetical protein